MSASLLALTTNAMELNWEILQEQIELIDSIQVLVLVFGIAQVLLARANHILLYPAGIISTVLSTYSLFHAQLYAESLLHLYYFVMSIYGWYHWSKKNTDGPAQVRPATRNEWVVSIGITFGGWMILYYVLKNFTPSTVPLWDAWISSTAWAGTWLLTRRRIENWILLNVSNAFAIPLLFIKELPLFALLTMFLFVVACFGYFDWMRIYRRESDAKIIEAHD